MWTYTGVRVPLPILAAVSQNGTNKSCFVKSGKYADSLRTWGEVNWSSVHYNIVRQGKAKLQILKLTSLSVSSKLQCWSQAVVCISKLRKYLQSGYLLVLIYSHLFCSFFTIQCGSIQKFAMCQFEHFSIRFHLK